MQFDATVLGKRMVTDRIGILRFDRELDFIPGQFCNISLGREVTRPYSMTSVPGEQLEFYIKSYPDGDVAHKILDLELGDTASLTGPLGQFQLDRDQDRICLIGAGSGVAPLVSMARVLDGDTEVVFLHGASHEDELGYRQILKELDVQYVPTVSRPEENENWDGRTGRVGEHIDLLQPDAAAYICGPPPMVQQVCGDLRSEGFKNIYTEQYY